MEQNADNAITKAVRVLAALRTVRGGASARELAVTTGIPRSTVQRTLVSLADTGMVIQDRGTQRYLIGAQALLIGLGFRDSNALVTEARPLMSSLRDTTGETIGLTIAVGDHRVFLEEVQSRKEIRFASELGRLYPIWSGANGRVLLSGYTDADIDRILSARQVDEGLFHPMSVEATRESVKLAREEGHSTAINEAIRGVNSVAMPIYGAGGEIVAAMSVSGPSDRFVPALMDAALEQLGEAVEAVSARLTGRVTLG